MRQKLKIRNGQRLRFKGIFDGYGLKSSFGRLPKQTLLLIDVENTEGEIVTNHLWFNLTKGFDALGDLYPGDVIGFDARVAPYEKGYADDTEIDYKLSYPTKITRLKTTLPPENYYTKCVCGFRNNTSRLPPEYPRCRRCSRYLKDSPPQILRARAETPFHTLILR